MPPEATHQAGQPRQDPAPSRQAQQRHIFIILKIILKKLIIGKREGKKEQKRYKRLEECLNLNRTYIKTSHTT